MKTKIEIIQRLLDERHINAEEALVLMEKEYIYTNPPIWYADPFPHYPVPYWQVVNGTSSIDCVISTN
jgi:hypothetical protein